MFKVSLLTKVITVSVLSACLLACGRSTEERVTTAQPKPAVEEPKIELLLEAAAREYSGALKICYDSAINGFLVEYFVDGKDSNPGSNKWFLISKFKSTKLSNGTYMMENSEELYNEVAPDVAGLPCRIK